MTSKARLKRRIDRRVGDTHKYCSKCKELKPIGEYSKANKRYDGTKIYCKKCDLVATNIALKKRRDSRKTNLSELHGGKCHDCNVSYPPYVYDFHHVEEVANNRISKLLTSKRYIEAIEESKRCIMLCANCHRIRHHSANWGKT